MLDVVGNPEDGFSHNEAHMLWQTALLIIIERGCSSINRYSV